ncbi:MAG: ABC transporter ATP-binding protein [Bacteroidales bacterium]|jgi:putative ABC transport system ATP-binding protein|nr:ABC transporter ATP-binding protein [Bacteroidales bacterium]
MIRTVNISKIYNNQEVETTALRDVNIEIKKGEFVSVIGPSGCGKTTLLNILGLLDNSSSGDLFFDGVDVSNYSEKQRVKIRRTSIGFVFQSFNLIDELTVFENIELPLLYLKVPAKERKKRVEDILARLELLHRRNNYPKHLSGGQQQKVGIARAVVTKPMLVLADEPTGNLDSISGDEVLNLLADINAEGTTVIIVTHSMQCAEKAQRMIKVFDGKIVTENGNGFNV